MLYFQLNIDYIVETYCINKDRLQLSCGGSCHLSKQLNFQNETPESDDATQALIVEAFYPVFFQEVNTKIDKNFTHFQIKNNWNYSFISTSKFVKRIYPPPRKA